MESVAEPPPALALTTSSPPNWMRCVRASRSASLSVVPGTWLGLGRGLRLRLRVGLGLGSGLGLGLGLANPNPNPNPQRGAGHLREQGQDGDTGG